MSTGMVRVRNRAAAIVVVSTLAWFVHAVAAPEPAVTKPSDITVNPNGTIPPQGPNELSALDARIKTLRTEYHAQLDPLEQQIKAVKERFEPQLADLESQRKTLAEARKPAGIQALDQKEDAELATLATKEKDELDKVHAQIQVERKAIQQRYADERKEAMAHR